MLKQKTNNSVLASALILALWLVSVISYLIYKSYALDFFGGISNIILLPIILFLPLLLPTVKKSIKSLPKSAIILTIINILFTLDVMHEMSTDDICGSGLGGGNCFLLDGLGIALYSYVMPLFTLITDIVLTIFILKRNKIN